MTAFVQGAGARATSGTVTATLGATPTNGNYLIAVFGTNGGGTPTPPTGFSVFSAPVAGSSTTIHMFIKQAGASEPTAVAMSPTTGNNWDLIVLEVSGMTVPTVDRIATATSGTTTVTTLTAGPTAALSAPAELVLGILSTSANPGTITPTTGYTATATYSGQRLSVSYKIDTDQSAKTINPSWVTTSRAVEELITIAPAAPTTSFQGWGIPI